MIRVTAYILIAVALLFAPVNRLDVAKLEPVEIVYISQDDDVITVSTDIGAWGKGENIQQALEMLHATTPGVVYLDTAEYLLCSAEAVAQIEQIRGDLHGSVRICLAERLDYEDLAEFLETHGKLPCLRTWKVGDPLPEYKNGKITQK